jgi:hypothetical protein
MQQLFRSELAWARQAQPPEILSLLPNEMRKPMGERRSSSEPLSSRAGVLWKIRSISKETPRGQTERRMAWDVSFSYSLLRAFGKAVGSARCDISMFIAAMVIRIHRYVLINRFPSPAPVVSVPSATSTGVIHYALAAVKRTHLAFGSQFSRRGERNKRPHVRP